ncbi:hypothetical protein LINPERHAP2_LOCUS15663, partial [Linum perenne]
DKTLCSSQRFPYPHRRNSLSSHPTADFPHPAVDYHPLTDGSPHPTVVPLSENIILTPNYYPPLHRSPLSPPITTTALSTRFSYPFTVDFPLKVVIATPK